MNRGLSVSLAGLCAAGLCIFLIFFSYHRPETDALSDPAAEMTEPKTDVRESAPREDDPTAKITVMASENPVIRGCVVDPKDMPVAGARVGLRPLFEERGIRETRSDAEGRFVFEGIRVQGEYELLARAKGYAVRWERVDTESGITERTLRLEPEAVAAGVVVDEEDRPVRDFTLMAYRYYSRLERIEYRDLADPSWNAFLDRTFDGAGAFRVRGLAPKVEYILIASREGFRDGLSEPVKGDREGLAIVMKRGGFAVGGIARHASNEAPIEGVEVRLLRDDGHRATVTDGKGRFCFRNVPLGDYLLKGGFLRDRMLVGESRHIDVEANRDDLVLRFTEAHAIRVRTVELESGEPLSGRRIRVTNVSNRDHLTRNGVTRDIERSDAQGRIRFDGPFENGRYRFDHLGERETWRVGEAILPEAGRDEIELRIRMRPLLAGIVLDDGRRPVPGALVSARGEISNIATTRSGEDGRFTFHELSVPPLTVGASHPRFILLERVPVDGSVPGEVVIRMRKARVIRGRVVNEAFEGIAGAYITCWLVDDSGPSRSRGTGWCRTDGKGDFELEGQIPGTRVALDIHVEGYLDRTLFHDVDEDAAPLEVILSRGEVISLFLHDAEARPVTDRRVICRSHDAESGKRLGEKTDERGFVRFNVEPGLHDLMLIDDGNTAVVNSTRNRGPVASEPVVDDGYLFLDRVHSGSENLRFVLDRPPGHRRIRIHGVVRDAVTDQVLPRCKVSCEIRLVSSSRTDGKEGGKIERHVKGDERGIYDIELYQDDGEGAFAYRLFVRNYDYPLFGTDPVPLAAGDVVIERDIPLPREGRCYKVMVKDEAGLPVEGALVQVGHTGVYEDPDPLKRTTKASGSVVLERMGRCGGELITVEKKGYELAIFRTRPDEDTHLVTLEKNP